MKHSHERRSLPESGRLGNCWFGAALIVVITGPVLAVVGIGGSIWGMAGFLLIFGVAVAPLIARELRPSVTLLSSSEQTSGAPAAVDTGWRDRTSLTRPRSQPGASGRMRYGDASGLIRGIRLVDE